MSVRVMVSTVLLSSVLVLVSSLASAQVVGVNVLLNTGVTDDILGDIGDYGTVLNVFDELDALTLRARADSIPIIQALPYVEAANLDQERSAGPLDTASAEDFVNGLSTWNLDAINVTDYGYDHRVVDYDGAGVYVAVIDTGLLSTWRQYFPEERIAEEYAICFGGGGGEVGAISVQPNKWQQDTNAHGTHVTSTIIGYDFYGSPMNGVAPMATVIPVKVLNNNGWGWSSMVAAGIVYVADLKAGPLADFPVVINMSLGGSSLDAMEKAAIDYAIDMGVIIVAAAGNEGRFGMSYPGAYAPVISVAAAGYLQESYLPDPFYMNVADPTNPDQYYIAYFSSQAKPWQDLDVTAPGRYVVGPYQVNRGQISYYYLSGTSMASPHVAGIVALMSQQDPGLVASDAEMILETTALPLNPNLWPESFQGAGLVDAPKALNYYIQ